MEMYASEWIFGLFSSIIPIEKMVHFYENFFIEGWPFFYKVALGYLKFFE